MKLQFFSGLVLRSLLIGLLCGPLAGYAQTCLTPLDIHIANDISGSVDSREYLQSKDFVTRLGLTLPLGSGAQQSRIGISQWSQGSGRFVEYVFPVAGATFTSSQSDIVSYINAARPFSGGTDPYTALLRASEWVRENPISGRTAKPVIVLMTDASCGQIPRNLSSLATQVKSSGITIVVMAIDKASGCSALTGTQVASPGAYFSAADYNTLQANALSYISNLVNSACPPSNPVIDLSVALTSFEIINCTTTPGATANYTVTNNGSAAFSGTLDVAFYNGNPTVPGTQHLFTASSTQSIAANGGTYSGSTSHAALVNAATLYAVVNINGALGANAVPLSPILNGATLTNATEQVKSNNFSTAFTRTNGTGCTPYAQLDVQVTNNGVACDNQVTYTIRVCNTGTAAANVDPNNWLTPYPPAAFVQVGSRQLLGTSPFVGNTLPAGACATYAYTYNLNNAVAGTTYDYSADVKELPTTAPNSCNPANPTAIVDVVAAGYTWMDRNLGANRAATGSTDAQSYGNLYQWGRAADGHQCVNRYAGDGVNTSATTSTNATTPVPNLGNAWDGRFITESTTPFDWLTSQNNALWQGVSGTNNPCPAGYRLPTEVELQALDNSFSPNTSTGAFSSPVKMPVAGGRLNSNGSLYNVGSYGYYWSSTVSGTNARFLTFTSSNSLLITSYRALGVSVRCLKD